MKIYREFDEMTIYDYLRNNLWSGAKSRWDNMNEEERSALCDYLNEIGEEMLFSETQVNDFVWFDWDDIYQEMQENG